MVKRATLLPVWLSLTAGTLGVALFLTHHIAETKSIQYLIQQHESTQQVSMLENFRNVPRSAGEVLSAVIIQDARPEILERFLKRYNSPLVPHARYLVEVADKYELDYRLLPSIAMQESGGGKIIPPGSYNAWGYAITESQSLGFLGWEQAIDRVARGIKRDYIDQDLVTPEQIMTKYTPASLAKGGAWAKGVNFFMEQMP